jgi:hypothetical protein
VLLAIAIVLVAATAHIVTNLFIPWFWIAVLVAVIIFATRAAGRAGHGR